MRIVNLSQGSPDWLLWRDAGLGSSDARVILTGEHFGRTRTDLWQEKVGQSHRQKQTSAMARGSRLEPLARDLYERQVGVRAQPCCGVHDRFDFIRASFDGYNQEHSLVVEIKAPNAEDHKVALSGQVPTKYIPQCNHLLLVSGARVLHYVSYSDNRQFSPAQQLALVVMPRDEQAVRDLLEAELDFWVAVDTRTPPQT